MQKNDNILTGYCFLAALTENQNDLFNHVFVPICKRALSLYSLQGSTHGKATDIKTLILNEYGIDIPILMVKKLISASFKTISKKAKSKYSFNVLENGGSFQIEKYSFGDLELHYKKGQRDARALQNAFVEYLKSESIQTIGVPSFADFLNKNKKHLASFFKGSVEISGGHIDASFLNHVNFLEYIETGNHELFEIAKGLYIGSIVASFLEAGLDLEPKFDTVVEFYLDTPIILRALDLQKEEDKAPIDELLALIRKTGGKLKVLSITIDEVQGVLENAIANYNAKTPTTTINEACIRLGQNKAWLIVYNSKIEQNITATLKAEKVTVSSNFQEKHQKIRDVKALEDERVRKKNALHDVLAYLYVRDARGGSVSSFQKANKWFLTSNVDLLRFNISYNPSSGGVSEIVLPDALTSLLWLKDPAKLVSKVKTIGLSELMASTLNEEIASKELLNEFELNIKKLDGISDEDYKTLLESVAHQSAKNVNHFNEIAESDISKAQVEAHKILERERSRRAKTRKIVKDAQSAKSDEEVKNRKLSDSLKRIESELTLARNEVDNSRTLIEELSGKLNYQASSRKKYWRTGVGLICFVCFVLTFIFFDELNEVIRILLSLLSGTGWIWGLGSFLINLYKLRYGK